MKLLKKALGGILRFFASIAVAFGRIFNKGDVASNPAGKGTGNEARPRRRLVDGVDADRFTRLCALLVVGFVSLIGAVLIAASVRSGGHEVPLDDTEDANAGTSGSFTLTMAGNIMPTQDMLDSALGEGDYDFGSGMGELAPAMSGDITIAGLCGQVNAIGDESGVGGFDRQKNYPTALAGQISSVGINYVFGANQYAFANGYDGMCSTITNLHFKSVGMIGMTNDEPSRLNGSVVRVNGIIVGIAGYNCVSGEDYKKLTGEQKSYIAAVNMDADDLTARASSDIARLRSAGAEYIVICVNWGGPSTVAVSDFMRNSAKGIADAGADVIVGYGPCVVLEPEIVSVGDGDTARDCYVFYSLGCVYGDNSYAGNQKILGQTGKLSAAQKKALEDEKKRVAGYNAAMSRSMTVSLSVVRADDGNVSAESAVYTPLYMVKNSGQGEENAHLKYLAVVSGDYVSAEQRPAIFADDRQWESCKAAFRAVCAVADKLGDRLVLRGANSAPPESDVSDGKI